MLLVIVNIPLRNRLSLSLNAEEPRAIRSSSSKIRIRSPNKDLLLIPLLVLDSRPPNPRRHCTSFPRIWRFEYLLSLLQFPSLCLHKEVDDPKLLPRISKSSSYHYQRTYNKIPKHKEHIKPIPQYSSTQWARQKYSRNWQRCP